jgi:hypothetical protein
MWLSAADPGKAVFGITSGAKPGKPRRQVLGSKRLCRKGRRRPQTT